MTVQVQRRLFTADEYFRMIEAGILTKYDHVELIEGRVLEKYARCDREPGSYHMFTVHDVERMAEAGILHEDSRVELVEGDLIEMAPIGSRHSACVDKLNWLFPQNIDLQQVLLRVQQPVRLDPENQPQPDIVLARTREDFYGLRHPGPDEVLLLIEVAESSLLYDRDVKLGIYAKGRIPEVWIVDLQAEAIETLQEPAGDHYTVHHVLGRGHSIHPAIHPGMVPVLLKVDEILMPRIVPEAQ
jgi:Uma2 family endonuclease